MAEITSVSSRAASNGDDRPAATERAPVRGICNRCGFEVRGKPWGCKNPCPNCGTVYPLGDCSD